MIRINPTRTTAAAVGLGIALLSLVMSPAQAGKSYDNRDVRGEYKFIMNEAEWITEGSPPVRKIQYCVSAGTAIADGEGTMRPTGLERCSVDGVVVTQPFDFSFTYEVMPDGEVYLNQPSADDPTHGFIVNRRRTILFDSSTRTDPDYIYQHGTLMKQ